MEDILLNLLFLIFGIFTYVVFFHNKPFERENREFLIGIFSTFAILGCKLFAIPIFSESVIDLKYIPFFLGSIYGGWRVATGLFLIINVYNFFIYYDDFLERGLLSFLMLVIVIVLSKSIYNQLTKIKKVILAISIITLITLFRIVVMFDFSVFDLLLTHYNTFILIVFVNGVSIGLLIYICEYIKETTIIKAEYQETEKLRLVSDLAASVSHEVRNPLTVTRGFIQLLYEPGLAKEKMDFYLSLSLKELDRAESIISDYLTFAKPEEYSDFKTLNVAEEIEYLIEVIKPYAVNNDVLVSKDDVNCCFIKGDKHKFRQCLMNVMKNGIEAMPNGGSLIILVTNDETNVMITIEDSGIGMSKQQIERLGSPYHSTKEKGTGLGTMVVYRIIHSMSGSIDVASEIGKGTKFTFVFPSVDGVQQ